MNAPQPDIQPDDLQLILTTLRREFPTSAVDYIPKPDNIAALFRVIERNEIRHPCFCSSRSGSAPTSPPGKAAMPLRRRDFSRMTRATTGRRSFRRSRGQPK